MLHLDLCSGIGGFALAARWHGMQTVGFCEIDPWCRRVLAKNFPGVPQHDDVTTLDGRTVRRWSGGRPVSVLTAGYPCQPFSLAGKRMGEQDDRHLWPYIAALVADLRPAWCLFENVAGHITLGLDRVLADLEAAGYEVGPFVIPAASLGAPHRRDRVWILAHAIGADGEARGTNGVRIQEPPERPARSSQPALAHADRGGRDGRTNSEGQGSSQRGRLEFGGETLAHAEDGGIRRGQPSGEPGQPARGGETYANSVSDGLQGIVVAGTAPRPTERSGSGWEVEPGLGRALDGLSRHLARPWDGEWERDVPRVTAGCPDRVNKLKALGNAIVPQVAYVLMGSMFQSVGYEPIIGNHGT